MGLLGKLFSGKPRVTPEHVETAADFDRIVRASDLPVIVDIWSPSCGPCRRLMPVLVDVATRYEGRVRVAEMSTEADPNLLGFLGVRATPTLIIYRHGEELGRMTGFRPTGWFDEMIATEFPEDHTEA